MSSFVWKTRFSVGLRQIDQHNQHLFTLLHQLYRDLHNQFDTLEIKLEFRELLEYIVFHFACEEIWMTHASYDLIHEHQQEHMHIKQKIAGLYQDYDNGEISILHRFSSLSRLITSHIQKSDTTYGHFASDKLSSKLMTKGNRTGWCN